MLLNQLEVTWNEIHYMNHAFVSQVKRGYDKVTTTTVYRVKYLDSLNQKVECAFLLEVIHCDSKGLCISFWLEKSSSPLNQSILSGIRNMWQHMQTQHTDKHHKQCTSFTWGLLEASVLALLSFRAFSSLFGVCFTLDIQCNSLLTLSPCSLFSSSTDL